MFKSKLLKWKKQHRQPIIQICQQQEPNQCSQVGHSPPSALLVRWAEIFGSRWRATAKCPTTRNTPTVHVGTLVHENRGRKKQRLAMLAPQQDWNIRPPIIPHVVLNKSMQKHYIMAFWWQHQFWLTQPNSLSLVALAVQHISKICVSSNHISIYIYQSTVDLFAISSPAGRFHVARPAGRTGWLVDCFGL